jgi:hypothetical protein
VCPVHEGNLLDLSVALGGEIKKAIERVSFSLYPLPSVLCLRRLIVHAHTSQVPLPKAVSIGLSNDDTVKPPDYYDN